MAALADPTVTLLERRSALASTQRRRSTRGFSSSTASTCDSLIRCSAGRRRTPDTRAADRCMHSGSPTSSRLLEERARHLALATASLIEASQRSWRRQLERRRPAGRRRRPPTLPSRRFDLRLHQPERRAPAPARRRRRANRAGDNARAAALLEQARATAAPGDERATVVAHLAGIQIRPRDAVALYREALGG